MKLKKFWSVGGRVPGAPPLNPPLDPIALQTRAISLQLKSFPAQQKQNKQRAIYVGDQSVCALFR